MHESVIAWPAGIDYRKYPIHSYNELFIAATAETIWAWLAAASLWPEWYANSRDVEITGRGTVLTPDISFTWTTFHLRVASKVLVMNRPYDLGWNARSFGAHGFHGWKIIPQSGGCLVVTEEVQDGIGARLLRPFILQGLLSQHQRWLEGLARMARQGMPQVRGGER